MKIKNKELRAICSALFSLGNHQGDISQRWEIAKLAKKFNDADELLTSQVNQLVTEKGHENSNGQKTLSPMDKDYLKLMELDIDVDIDENCFCLSDLEQYSPTVQELMSLRTIIKEGD